jgi:serine/threonine protein kinase
MSSYECVPVTAQIDDDIDESFLQDIKILRKVSAGKFGEVFEGKWKGCNVALKTLKNNGKQAILLHEASVLRKLRHPRVVQFLGLYMDDNRLFMVTEYFPCGSLLDLLETQGENLSMEVKLIIMTEVAAAMSFLENSSVIHRDLAARNCLYTREADVIHVKLADFGLSVLVEGKYYKNNLLKPPFRRMAPETVRDGLFSTKSDVWAFGVLFWEVLHNGQKPFAHIKTQEEFLEWTSNGNTLPLPQNLGPTVKAIILGCWDLDPKKRPPFGDIVEILTKLVEQPVVPPLQQAQLPSNC